MDDMREILLTQGKEAWHKAMLERKRAREEAERTDPMREVKEALRARIAGAPQYITYAISPVPNFLQGKVPADAMIGRVHSALTVWESGELWVRETLQESYMQEVELLLVIRRAFQEKDAQDEDQLAAIRQEVQAALEAYMAQPPMERKHYLL